MPGPYLAADGFDVSAGAGSAGFSVEGGGVVGAGVSGAGVVAGGGVVGAGVDGAAAGGSEGRAGSCGAPHPAAANVSAHTTPTIHLVIAHSFLAFTVHRFPFTVRTTKRRGNPSTVSRNGTR